MPPKPRLTRRSVVAAAVVALSALLAGCPEPEPASEPVATSRPAAVAEPTPPPEPAPESIAKEPPDHNRVEVRVQRVTDPQHGWLRIEAIREGAPGAWATGRFIPDNRIEIETEAVSEFSLDVSDLHINWDRRVVLKIDGRASELIRKKSPVIHLQQDQTGAWNVVKP